MRSFIYQGTTIGNRRICALVNPFAEQNALLDDSGEKVDRIVVKVTAARDEVFLSTSGFTETGGKIENVLSYHGEPLLADAHSGPETWVACGTCTVHRMSYLVIFPLKSAVIMKRFPTTGAWLIGEPTSYFWSSFPLLSMR